MSEILLGKDVKYKDFYDNSLLFPIKRSLNRNKIITQSELPFNGYDLWNCYELSWLNLKGKPEVRILHFVISANSEYLIESKSIKLYLNSFNNTKFTNEIQVLDLITKDLSSVSG
jgi:7-cyano-7-deazaguanine reductase